MRFRAPPRWLFATATAAAALLGAAYLAVAASLPRREGTVRVAALTARVEIALDAHAIPTVWSTSFEDALRAEGYLHAQERFFQMDLLRRSAAGELAALVGPLALPADRTQRPFGYRALARALLRDSLPPLQAGWLAAYAEGVNAGLADLRARPPEYWLLRAQPEPWSAEDSLLAVLSFYTLLSNNDAYERGQGVLHETLPPALYEFLTPSTSRFDRPLLGASAADPTGGYRPAPIPGPDVVDLRTEPALAPAPAPHVAPPLLGPASNQWALDATRGPRGQALLANDPHLRLLLPNVFYRVLLEWPGGALRGASIPGMPGVLIGASEHVAFGATVSNADQSDWVVVEVDPSDPGRYRTPEGFEPFREVTAEIAVAGGAAETIKTRHTRWGPVVATDWRGRPLALHAAWLEPQGLNLDIVGIAAATDVASAVELLASWRGPSLNWMLADRAGAIGWVVNGPLPRRVGFDGSRPESLADGTRGWQGVSESPRRVGGARGALFTANSRTLGVEEAARLSRMWMRPFRAKRIDDLLGERASLDERDSLAMQLDTRAEGYEQLRDVVLEVVAANDASDRLARARAHVATWNGRADVDQPGFRILHVYYLALMQRALEPLLADAIAADPTLVYRWPLADEVLRRLLDERPAHLLTREHRDWPAFLRTVLLDTLEGLERDGHGLDAPWGEVNELAVAHPLGGIGALAPLAAWLKLPAAPLPGSMVSLRVAAPDYGAVLRMSVTPAAPERGILQLAGGQSGHFLSPQFRDLNAEWLAGTPTPFLGGERVGLIVLEP